MGESDPDPFGGKGVPWWRTLLRAGGKGVPWWRTLLRAGGKGRAPRRYAGVAAALGPIFGLIVHSGDGLDGPARVAIFAALTFIPPLLVERWWRERERRQEERLLVFPERAPTGSASG